MPCASVTDVKLQQDVMKCRGEDMVEGSWTPRECPLPLRCRREDRSVGEREGKVYRVCVCVCVCVAYTACC